MKYLLEMARKKGYRNRWHSVLSHLSVNETSETGTLEFDFHALLLINFIINELDSVDKRTDERRLLTALQFDESIKKLQQAIEETNIALVINKGGHSEGGGGGQHHRRQSTLRNLKKDREHHTVELCRGIEAQISTFNMLRNEDITELKVF